MSSSDKYDGPYAKDAIVVMFDLALDASFPPGSPQIIPRDRHFGIRCISNAFDKTNPLRPAQLSYDCPALFSVLPGNCNPFLAGARARNTAKFWA